MGQTFRKPLPSYRNKLPNLASHKRIAFVSIAWNTGSSSPGELEITPSTSEVAVCCSSASAAAVVPRQAAVVPLRPDAAPRRAAAVTLQARGAKRRVALVVECLNWIDE